MMTHDFDTVLKEAAAIRKQREIDLLLASDPMPMREKTARRMRKRLQNSRSSMRQIIAIAVAAVVLLTCLGMALPQIRDSLRSPLLTLDRTYSGYAMELENGILHRITDGESGMVIESTDVYTGETLTLPIPVDGVEWSDLSVTKQSFTLLGRDKNLRYLELTRDGKLLHDIPLPELDDMLDDHTQTVLNLSLAGDMVVILRHSENAKTERCDLNVFDPVNGLRRYLCGNAVTCFTSGEALYFITSNNPEYPAPEFVYPNNMYRLDSFTSDLRVLWEVTLPFPLTAGAPLGYDTETGILYFTQNLTLAAADLKNGKTATALHSHTYVTVRQVDSGLLLYDTAGSAMVCRIPDGYFDTADRVQLTDLKIAEPGIPGASAEAYPEVFRSMWEDGFNLYGSYTFLRDYEETVRAKLENGDTDFDIFYLDSSTASLLDGDYLADLTVYPILDSVYGDMLDGVKSLCTADGVTGMIPLSLYTMMMRQNSALCLEELTLPSLFDGLIPMKNAYSSLLRTDSRFMSSSSAHSLLMPWFEQTADNYRAGNLSREEALDALTLLLKTARDFDASSEVRTVSGYSNTPVYLLCLQNKGAVTAVSPAQTPIISPMLKMNENCAHTFSGSWYAVNPNSPHRKEAAAFLAYLTEHLRTSGKSPETAQLYRDFTPAAANAESYQIFREQLKDSILSREIPRFSARLADLTEQYISGKIPESSAAGQILAFIDETDFHN